MKYNGISLMVNNKKLKIIVCLLNLWTYEYNSIFFAGLTTFFITVTFNVRRNIFRMSFRMLCYMIASISVQRF